MVAYAIVCLKEFKRTGKKLRKEGKKNSIDILSLKKKPKLKNSLIYICNS